ncbi:class I SAM-dependent methyltransferase [bacterium]|nr:class I SAM-dependent methyltransferase [bacterium]
MSVSRETIDAGLPLDPAAMSRLRDLAAWIARMAYPLGLTNYGDAETVLQEAILPTVALLPLLPTPLTGSWADLGPGSGAIGLTLALLEPGITVDLLDRRERVIAYLDLSLAHLGISNARARQTDLSVRKPVPGTWDGVAFRAFGPPATTLALAASLSRSWVSAWHSPQTVAYQSPPEPLTLVSQRPTTSPGLLCSLFRRK